MKIYCNRTELNKALNNLSHAIPVRTTSNILEGVLVDISDNLMLITSTDTKITIECKLEVQADCDFSFVVPYKLFGSIVSKLTEEELVLDFDADKLKLNIKCGGSDSELICFKSDDFPKLLLSEEGYIINLSKEDVKKLIKKTAFSASSDDFNGILTGVLLEIKDGNMKMIGVDPFRIATYNIKIDSDADISVVIPAKLIIEVSKIMSEDGEDRMTLEIIDKKVIFRFDNNKVIINTFSGKFIDYERILNQEGEINIRVQRNELLKSIDRASLVASVQTNNLIKFDIEGDLILINSLNEEGNIKEKIEIIKEGEDIRIGMNSRYLKDVLSVIEDEELIINLKNSTSPCIIKPLKGDKYKYLVLPIRIN